MADPIFFPFGSNGGRFTDPFELFNSIFGDVSRQFHNDPFFNDAFPSSSRSPFGRGAPFGNNPFGGSMFGPGPSSIFSDMHGGNFPLGTTHSAYTSSQSSAFGSNGRWTSQSQVPRTRNGGHAGAPPASTTTATYPFTVPINDTLHAQPPPPQYTWRPGSQTRHNTYPAPNQGR